VEKEEEENKMISICEQYTMLCELNRNWNVHNTFKTIQTYDNIYI
jgi:hypothetical protein